MGDLASRKRVLSWVFPTVEISMLLGKCSTRVDTCGKRPVKPKAVSGWGDSRLTLYLFYSALEKKVTCFPQPLGV